MAVLYSYEAAMIYVVIREKVAAKLGLASLLNTMNITALVAQIFSSVYNTIWELSRVV